MDDNKDRLKQELASLTHDIWSEWWRLQRQHAVRVNDGRLIIDGENAERWSKKARKAYGKLTKKEQQLVNEIVDRYLAIFDRYAAKQAASELINLSQEQTDENDDLSAKNDLT